MFTFPNYELPALRSVRACLDCHKHCEVSDGKFSTVLFHYIFLLYVYIFVLLDDLFMGVQA